MPSLVPVRRLYHSRLTHLIPQDKEQDPAPALFRHSLMPQSPPHTINGLVMTVALCIRHPFGYRLPSRRWSARLRVAGMMVRSGASCLQFNQRLPHGARVEEGMRMMAVGRQGHRARAAATAISTCVTCVAACPQPSRLATGSTEAPPLHEGKMFQRCWSAILSR
jgi:hypothetical protein